MTDVEQKWKAILDDALWIWMFEGIERIKNDVDLLRFDAAIDGIDLDELVKKYVKDVEKHGYINGRR